MNGTGADGAVVIPAPMRTAVDRLYDVREHQESLGREFARNWRGWLGSFVFHSAVLLLLVVLTWNVIGPPPLSEIPLFTELAAVPELATPSMEELLLQGDGNSRLDTSNAEDVPNTPFDQDKPSASAPGPGELGVPDHIGQGWDFDGIPGGGPGGNGPLAGIPGDGDMRVFVDTFFHGKLDLVFVFDSTGSMGGIILEVKTRIRQFIACVTYFVPDTRLGIVTYRDKKKYDLDDYEYTVRYLALTRPKDSGGLGKIQRFLRETEAIGGGDIPEAVYDGVDAAINKMAWRPGAKRVIIVFGDAPPRPEDTGVSKLVDLIRTWRERTRGVVSCIDTTGSSKLMDEFRQMAAAGGGQSCSIQDESGIVRQILVSVFPPEVKVPVERIYDRYAGTNHEKDVVEQK